MNSISKLFERCLLKRIGSEGNLDDINQHGFCPGHSTVTAALEVQNFIADALDSGQKCLVYSTDLSAAFDLIRPGIFAKKARPLIGDGMAHI